MLRRIAIIISPFHVGLHRHRVGKGPEAILEKLQPTLEEHSISYRIATIDQVDSFEGEIGRSFAVLRQIAVQTRLAVTNNEFPIILAGNCNSSAAVLAALNAAGLDQDDVDLFWADAHADAHIPDDSGIGYFDSMGTAMLAGLCWKGHMENIEGHKPFSLSRLHFLGVRSYEPEELSRLRDHKAEILSCERQGMFKAALEDHLEQKCQRRRAFVHVDLDVLDTSVGYANDYASEGGLLPNDFISVLDLLAKRDPVSLTLASLDPDLEGGEKIVRLAVQGILKFLESARIISSG